MVSSSLLHYSNSKTASTAYINTYTTNPNSPITSINFTQTNPSSFVTDYDVNMLQTTLAFIEQSNSAYYTIGLYDHISANFVLNSSIQISSPPTNVFVTPNAIYKYYKNPSGNDSIAITNLRTFSTITHILSHSNSTLTFTPNKLKAVAWTNVSVVYIYSSNFTLLNINYACSVATPYQTSAITFSFDSTMAIISAQTYTNIVVLSLITYSTLYSTSISFSMSNLIFLTAKNDYIVITSSDSSSDTLWELTTNTLYTFSVSLYA